MRAAIVWLAALAVGVTGPAVGALGAQSVLERSPNLEDPWTPIGGRLHFHFVHRFDRTGPPARKVLNSPTFLVAVGLPLELSAGMRYASSSLLVPGHPNELELFGRWTPLAESRGAPISLGVQTARNQAAESWDVELSVARRIGFVRLLGAGRAFSDFAGGEEAGALSAGVVVDVLRHAALAADWTTPVGVDDRDAAWSAGVQLEIPYTPHTLSLHATNANTTTLQGASYSAGGTRWGFEFTVPLTLARYTGGDEPADPGPGSTESSGTADVVVEMDDRLRFLPDTIRVTVGETVEWRNASSLVHTVTADPEKAMESGNVELPDGAAAFDSGMLAPGAVFEHTFRVPGTYRYVCVPHEPAGMAGVVIVEPGDAPGM